MKKLCAYWLFFRTDWIRMFIVVDHTVMIAKWKNLHVRSFHQTLRPTTLRVLFAIFSRMRSEGFPFIVGVWGWTRVRVVLLCRRRLVVVSSSCRRGCVVNSLPLGGTFALRHTSYFQSMKSGGSLARNALFGGPKSQNGRSFSCFAWQAQYFGSDSMEARRFFVAGAALCDVAFRDVVASAAFCDVAKVLFP